MSKIELHNIIKTYTNSAKESFNALNKVSLSLNSTGLVGILGKSGSGKSTLLNMISMVDKPTSGTILIDNKDILKWKEKDKLFYMNEQCGFLFQNYNLLEDESGYYNVSLPLLIKGINKKRAIKDIDEYLTKVNLTKDLMEKNVSLLSGGERQRVSLLRSIINSPRILFCDEPTGALDSKNALIIMNILKKYSERHLVLVVTHNEKLINEFADRIIVISDGKITSDTITKQNKTDLPFKENQKYKQSSSWIDHLVFKNLRRKYKRNILSFLGLLVGSLSSLLVIGFYSGSKNSIKTETYKQLDYGVGSVSKETNNKIENSIITIVQTTRPSYSDLNDSKSCLLKYYIEPDFSVLLPQKPNIFVKNEEFSNLLFSPVYSFDNASIDDSLIVDGRNVNDEKNEVLINKNAYKIIKEQTGLSPINQFVHISQETKTSFQFDDGNIVEDQFTYDQSFRIVGVVDELSFLQNPKIYYSYSNLCNYMSETYALNLSLSSNRDISWYERIASSSNIDSITNYSYSLFLKDIKNSFLIKEDCENINKPLTLSFNSILISNTYESLISSATCGIIIFLIIALIGTALIIGIVSFSSYTSDKRRSAILSLLGASKDSITSIYISENIVVCLLSICIAFALSPLFSWILNSFIKSTFGLNNLINIPFASFLDIPFLLPIIILIVFTTITLLSTIIPILFNKKSSYIEELRTE